MQSTRIGRAYTHPLLADLDGDGTIEVIAGKRFQGHEGKGSRENEPLRVVSYQFDRQSRSWTSRLISNHPKCGLDLDPKCIDIDADGDLDVIGPARSVLGVTREFPHSFRTCYTGCSVGQLRAAAAREAIVHNDFRTMIAYENGEATNRADSFGFGRG